MSFEFKSGIVLETKLVADIKGAFYVPSYQRGYRWGENEVVRLLEDIHDAKGNYCLQPVVVKKSGGTFELIDGQQRLTTIYLLEKYLHEKVSIFEEPDFTLEYETRPKTKEYLKPLATWKEAKAVPGDPPTRKRFSFAIHSKKAYLITRRE